jgi:hypothetical protein
MIYPISTDIKFPDNEKHKVSVNLSKIILRSSRTLSRSLLSLRRDISFSDILMLGDSSNSYFLL